MSNVKAPISNPTTVLHIVSIQKNGDVGFKQGFGNQVGMIKKEALPYYIERFNWSDQEKIKKDVEHLLGD
ncbi:MAG: hypothetical protein GY804_09660 [Alphaproteobacteria bacterium]|nr:hypothetical protein [Alphaproteobacteria bacterium]